MADSGRMISLTVAGQQWCAMNAHPALATLRGATMLFEAKSDDVIGHESPYFGRARLSILKRMVVVGMSASYMTSFLAKAGQETWAVKQLASFMIANLPSAAHRFDFYQAVPGQSGYYYVGQFYSAICLGILGAAGICIKYNQTIVAPKLSLPLKPSGWTIFPFMLAVFALAVWFTFFVELNPNGGNPRVIAFLLWPLSPIFFVLGGQFCITASLFGGYVMLHKLSLLMRS